MIIAKLKRLFIEKNDELWIAFLRFLLAGGFVVILDTAFYYCLAVFFSVYYIAANSISFVVCTTFEFLISRQWVFNRKNRKLIGDYLLFFGASVVCLLLSNIILFVLVDRGILTLLLSGVANNIILLLAKIIAVIVITFLDFWIKKTFVFGRN
jgi:putative flippase GtrA